MEKETKKSWISILWEKKLPQFLGTYFAVGFGLLQFLEFAVNRYELPKSFFDKYLTVWFILAPAIIILAYFRDEFSPTNDKKSPKWTKYAIAGNVAIAFVLGSLLPINKAMAKANVVQLMDEEGNQIEAVVPALERIKNIACFQFINDTGDPELDWWGPAFSNLLGLSLMQWPEFYVSSQFELDRHYDGLGLESFTVPNLGLQREIAKKSRNDYYSRFAHTLADGTHTLSGTIYSTENGNKIAAFEVADKDPYVAVDKLAQNIYSHYYGKVEGQTEAIHMSASALMTSNQEALENLTKGLIDLTENPNELDNPFRLAKKSVEQDPTCSTCHLVVSNILLMQKNLDAAKPYAINAVKYGASLPKRFQFTTKENYYAINNDLKAYFNLLELKLKMFPYEFEPYERLWPLYLTNKGIDSTEALLNTAIDNGNVEKGLLALYDAQMAGEKYASAEQTLLKFTREFPEREQDQKKFADVFQRQGKLDKAKDALLKLEALNPLDTEIQQDLANLEFKTLEFEKAFKRIEKGMSQSTTLTDSLSFIWTKSFFQRRMGQQKNALETISEYKTLALKRMPEIVVMQKTFFPLATIYLSTHKADEVMELISSLKKYLPEQGPIYQCFIHQIAVENDYPTNSDDKSFLTCSDLMKDLGEGVESRYKINQAFNSKDYEKSLAIFKTKKEILKNIFSDYHIANIYLKAEKREEAKQYLQKNIDKKTDWPDYYLKMAEVLENESPETAKKHLATALQFWGNADEDFIPYQRAKAIENRLGAL